MAPRVNKQNNHGEEAARMDEVSDSIERCQAGWLAVIDSIRTQANSNDVAPL
jgi:hypothetical protein